LISASFFSLSQVTRSILTYDPAYLFLRYSNSVYFIFYWIHYCLFLVGISIVFAFWFDLLFNKKLSLDKKFNIAKRIVIIISGTYFVLITGSIIIIYFILQQLTLMITINSIITALVMLIIAIAAIIIGPIFLKKLKRVNANDLQYKVTTLIIAMGVVGLILIIAIGIVQYNLQVDNRKDQRIYWIIISGFFLFGVLEQVLLVLSLLNLTGWPWDILKRLSRESFTTRKTTENNIESDEPKSDSEKSDENI